MLIESHHYYVFMRHHMGLLNYMNKLYKYIHQYEHCIILIGQGAYMIAFFFNSNVNKKKHTNVFQIDGENEKKVIHFLNIGHNIAINSVLRTHICVYIYIIATIVVSSHILFFLLLNNDVTNSIWEYPCVVTYPFLIYTLLCFILL